jgi:hypothetical protein
MSGVKDFCVVRLDLNESESIAINEMLDQVFDKVHDILIRHVVAH